MHKNNKDGSQFSGFTVRGLIELISDKKILHAYRNIRKKITEKLKSIWLVIF